MKSWRRRTSGSGPVNMLGGPDGTLYVVDMYRGVVQEAVYWTDYLRDYIKDAGPGEAREARTDLADRARHDAARPRAARCRRRLPQQLVQALVAPERLVARHGAAAARPARRDVRRAAAEAARRRSRRTGAPGSTRSGRSMVSMRIDPAQVERALADKSADVRASAHPVVGAMARASRTTRSPGRSSR